MVEVRRKCWIEMGLNSGAVVLMMGRESMEDDDDDGERVGG